MNANHLHLIVFAILAAGNLRAANGNTGPNLLWARTYVSDSNMALYAGRIQVDEVGGIIHVGGSRLKAKPEVKESPGDIVLWTIDPNGKLGSAEVLSSLPEGTNNSVARQVVKGVNCSPNGDVALVSQIKDELRTDFVTKGLASHVSSISLRENPTRRVSIVLNKTTFLADSGALTVGQQDRRAMVVKTDKTGTQVWKRIYNADQADPNVVEVFNDVALFPRDPNDFILVGRSVTMDPQETLKQSGPSEVLVTCCGSDGHVLAARRISAPTSGFDQPAVCALSDGRIVLVYARKVDQGSEIVATVMSPDLERILWEKVVFSIDRSSSPVIFLKALSVPGGIVIVHNGRGITKGLGITCWNNLGEFVANAEIPESSMNAGFDAVYRQGVLYVSTSIISPRVPKGIFRVAAFAMRFAK
jgi:hypothetical protein